MIDFTIRATPEALLSASEDISREAGIIEDTISIMQTKMQQTASFWIGDAAELHRSLFDEQLPELETLAKCFRIHSDKLRQISGNYTAAKLSAMEITEALPNDVIV